MIDEVHAAAAAAWFAKAAAQAAAKVLDSYGIKAYVNSSLD